MRRTAAARAKQAPLATLALVPPLPRGKADKLCSMCRGRDDVYLLSEGAPVPADGVSRLFWARQCGTPVKPRVVRRETVEAPAGAKRIDCPACIERDEAVVRGLEGRVLVIVPREAPPC